MQQQKVRLATRDIMFVDGMFTCKFKEILCRDQLWYCGEYSGVLEQWVRTSLCEHQSRTEEVYIPSLVRENILKQSNVESAGMMCTALADFLVIANKIMWVKSCEEGPRHVRWSSGLFGKKVAGPRR